MIEELPLAFKELFTTAAQVHAQRRFAGTGIGVIPGPFSEVVGIIAW